MELPDGAVVVSSWARPEESVKCIEQAGAGYETLKVRYSKLAQRIQEGKTAHFESEDS